MKTLKGDRVLITKTLFKEVECFYNDFFSEYKFVDGGVIVDEKDIIKIINLIKNETRLTSINFIRKIGQVDKSEFEGLNDKYTESKYEIARNKFEHIGEEDLYDELISNGIKLCEEMKKLKTFPAIRNHIKEMIIEIKQSKIFNDIKKIEEKFVKLCSSSAKIEEFEKLSRNLAKIISDTYKDNLSNLLDITKESTLSIIASDEDKNCFLLSNENLKEASFGLILPFENNIKYASNKQGEKVLLPFGKLNKKENFIEVYDFTPVAAYATTLGEKSLSENYINAQKVAAKYHNIPIIEFDLSKYMTIDSSSEIFRTLIDQLLDDKNISISHKDNEFYSGFENFYKEYRYLKSSAYDEGRIRNLFDLYMRLLTSEEICNLDSLLNDYKYIEIDTVMKYNPFMEDNIFRYDEISKSLLERFIDKFYLYRNDVNLNRLYPGFSVTLSYLKERSDEELRELVDIINQMNRIDSWLLAQTFDPTHSQVQIIKENAENNFRAYLDNNFKNKEDEKEVLLSLKEYLSSYDEDKQNGLQKAA